MTPLDKMIAGEWIRGEMLPYEHCNHAFIDELAFVLMDLHNMAPEETDWPDNNMFDLVNRLEPVDEFTENAILEFTEIKPQLTGKVPIHGDLWRQNIRVDEEGYLSGIIDWEDASIGDPHWDFRMIRRWIGWNGLDGLLFMYNCGVKWECKREYIEILDRISLCHSIQIRKKRGLLRHDKPDAIERFEAYKKIWPKSIPLPPEATPQL